MRKETATRIGVTLCVALGLATASPGCGGSPTSPLRMTPPPPTSPPAPPPQSRTLTVVSGWDLSPVPGARVRVNDAAVSVDAAGQFICSESVPEDAAIDVDAQGFLPHRTTLREVPDTNMMALWPAAGDAEANAIRAMVFDSRSDRLIKHSKWTSYWLSLLVEGAQGDPDMLAQLITTWTREYAEMQEFTGLRLSVAFAPRGLYTGEFEEEVIVVFDGTAETCSSPWGFCAIVGHSNEFPYFSRPYRVVRALADRPDVIRRVLAHGLLNAHAHPGLLNRTAPAPTLSLLEKQTLKMQAVRPDGTRWPDRSPSR